MKKNKKETKHMNKKDFVTSVAELSGLSKKDSTQALDAIIESIQKWLKHGNDVSLTGFGTFRVIKRKARNGRNPRTGETIKIAASKRPTFRSGKILKESIT